MLAGVEPACQRQSRARMVRSEAYPQGGVPGMLRACIKQWTGMSNAIGPGRIVDSCHARSGSRAAIRLALTLGG